MNPISGEEKRNRGRRDAGKVSFFGILERGGNGKVKVVGEAKGDAHLELAIKKVMRGNAVMYEVK